MILTWIVLFIFVLFGLLTFRRKDLFSPWTITFCVWIVEIACFLTFDHGLYATTGNFEQAVLLWVISFCGSSFIVYDMARGNSPTKHHIAGADYNSNAFRIMFWISIICVPITVYLAYKYALANAITDNIFFELRYNTTQSENRKDSILKYTTYIALIPLLAECNAKKINTKRLILLYFLNVVLMFSSMSKISLFTSLISSVFVLVYNKRIKPRVFIYIFIAFIGLTILFSAIRSFYGDIDADRIGAVLSVYTLSPISAFDYVAESVNQTYDGSYTLRFFYQLAKSLGADVDVRSTIQDFVQIPHSTNVYTVFYQYYKDFGYFGIFIFGLINGSIYGFVYSRIAFNPKLKLFYSYLVVTLFLQFFAELFWTTLSSTIQVFLCSYLVYVRRNKKRIKYCCM